MASDRNLICQDCGHHVHQPQACQWDFWPDHRRCPCPAATSDVTFGELREELDRAWAIVDRQAKELDELRLAAPAASEINAERLARALETEWDSPIHSPVHAVSTRHSGWLQLRPTSGFATRIAATYARQETADE